MAAIESASRSHRHCEERVCERRGNLVAFSMFLAAAVAALLPLPAVADIVVTTDGMSVETQGPWEVRGASVVFHNTHGQLVSLPAAQVDLAASRKATAAAAAASEPAAEEPAPEPAQEPVLVLTDADVSHVNPQSLEVTDEDQAEGDEEAEPQLVVTDWNRLEDAPPGGITLSGTVSNRGEALASAVRVHVDLYDGEGQRLGGADASVNPSNLQPGGEGVFRVTVPNIFSFVGARFQVQSTTLATTDQAPAGVPGTPNP